MENVTIDQLKENLVSWRAPRKIDDQSSFAHQIQKYNEENTEMKDAIGDQIVCLLNAESFAKEPHQIDAIRFKIAELEKACDILGIDPAECCGMAWGEIKNRAGMMVSGLYVKFENLNHARRLELCKSGMVYPSHPYLGRYLECCTKDEQDELVDAMLEEGVSS